MDPLYQEALREFERVYRKVSQTSLNEPTAVILATADRQGRPSARTVLLKSFDGEGFVFYTNRESRKGTQLAANPWGALCFYWDPLGKQAHVEGPVERVSEEESDAYWATRPRASQIGAWASLQSRPMKGRAELLARVARYEAEFLGRPVPRPPFWGGYRLRPQRIEFWTRKPFRLHERVLYCKGEEGWFKQLLYP